MSDKMIMEFHIHTKGKEISHMNGINGEVTIIPFDGTVSSDLFCGEILPGAADIQVTNPAGVRHMCARYMFHGTDSCGKECFLYVENNGYFERDNKPRPFEACPVFMTDSEVLAPYLHTARFRSEGYGYEGGVDIRIYEISRREGNKE